MRRLYLFLSFVMATAWLLWAACETDDYRSVLPLRPLDGGPAADLLPRPDQGSVTDGGTITDGGQLPDGAVAG